jgi:ACT domain-containing protein
MLITLVVELEDKPGQLVKVLEPISKFGGNIVGIVHQRGKKTPLNRVPVEISLKIDEKRVESLIEALQSSGIIVRSYNEVRLTATTSLLLIGHIIHTDLSDTVNRIDSSGTAEVVEVNISMPKVNAPSTAMVTISAVGKAKLGEAIEKLRKICKEKDIIVIEPINEEFA